MADLTPPTVQWSDDHSGALNRYSPIIVYTLNFSEPVTGLEASDLTVNKGQVTAVSGSASSWKVTVAIYDATSGQMEITLKAGAVIDAAGNANAASTDASQAIDTLTPAAPTVSARGISATLLDPRVRFDTSLGSFTLELDPDLAPFSANNLLSYAFSDFYAGTIFHRIVNDPQTSGMQIVQGGGMNVNMTPKATADAIPLESANGLSNVRGTVAMARTNAPNSGTSQFYINVDDNLFLDYQSQMNPGYAVFGRVIEGMQVIDTMLTKPVNSSSVPLTNIVVTKTEIIQEPSRVFSRTGLLDVGQLEAGAFLLYSVDRGVNAAQATSSTLSLPEGNYDVGDILLQQIDAAGNRSNPGMYGRTLVVDKTAPQFTSISPTSGTTQIQPGSNIVLSFNEEVLLGSGSFTLKTAAGAELATLKAGSDQVKVSGKSITITPAKPLATGTDYSLEWTAEAVTDLAGNPLPSAGTSAFKTANSVGPHFWKSPLLTPASTGQKAAVDLNDAIAVLKMVVGLPVNSDGSGASAAQAIAADFDQDHQVGLNDAIGILKLLVDLPGSPQPQWKYFDTSTLPKSLSAAQALSHGSWLPPEAQASQASATVDLVGVLTGDVNGSWQA